MERVLLNDGGRQTVKCELERSDRTNQSKLYSEIQHKQVWTGKLKKEQRLGFVYIHTQNMPIE